jgi:sulfate adenylyltransferase subunit 1 (EFTu-like GTPase family)
MSGRDFPPTLARRLALLGQPGAGTTSLAQRLLLAYHPLGSAACPAGGRLQVLDGSGEEDWLETLAQLRGAAAAALVIDATRPSYGHAAFAAQLLGAPRLVAAVNKMDLVGYAHAPFEQARAAIERIAVASGAPAPLCVPVSARDGELITSSSARAPWYRGPTLVEALLEK